MAAAKAVLDILTASPVLDNLARRGERLKAGLDQILTEANLPHQMTGHPNIQSFLITENPVKEVRDFSHTDEEMYEKILTHLYHLGVWAEGDSREPWFLCESHSNEIIDETLNKFQEAVKRTLDK
jgi:glutamate-1-semialdehyde 2,1-aminomutase